MSFPAIKDGDHPSGGGSTCSTSRFRGFNSEILQCDNGIWYRLFLGDNIQLDFNPDRILLKHGDTLLEVKSDGIYVDGDLFVNGNLNVSGDISCENLVANENISCDELFVNSPKGTLNVGSVLSGLMP